MRRIALPYSATGQFKPIVLDYLDDDPKVRPFRAFAFDRSGLDEALGARVPDPATRVLLLAALRRQYEGMTVPARVEEELRRLADPAARTVTTGHQLCLFGGPLFVLLKVLNVVRLAKDLSTPQLPVVPVFWMASEDHDLAEVDHVYLRGRRVHWAAEAAGAVGRMSLKAMDAVVANAVALLGEGPGATGIVALLRDAYRDGNTLAQATRILITGLFGRFGVVVVDGDDPALKRLFAPLMREELLNEVVQRTVRYAGEQLPADYEAQAHAREINLFHLSSGRRARLVREAEGFRVLDGGPVLRTEELLAILDRSPEEFSPNVLLRPLYQERVLPNVAYVGGGGEVAYWLQLRWLFQAFQMPMPVVCLRTSAVFLAEGVEERLAALGLSLEDLFQPTGAVENKLARKLASFPTTLEAERSALEDLYRRIADRAPQAGPTFQRSVMSARTRSFHGLEHLEHRLVRTAKLEQAVAIGRYRKLREGIFPHGMLQERHEGFITLLADHGPAVMDELIEALDPIEKRFSLFLPA